MTRIKVDTTDLKNQGKDIDSAADEFTMAADDTDSTAMATPGVCGRETGGSNGFNRSF